MYEKEIAVFRSDFEEPLREWRQKSLEEISLDDIDAKYNDLKVRTAVYDKNMDKYNRLDKVVEVKIKEIETDGLTIYIAENKKYIGYIVLEDEIREESFETDGRR